MKNRFLLLIAVLLAALTASAGNIIYYTSTDGQVVNPNAPKAFGANIVSNTYEDGQGKIVFDGEVAYIGYTAFFASSRLASIVIPNSARYIGSLVFYGCSNLESVEIPISVTSIGERAFWETGLKSVVIPDSVASIANEVFYDCRSLASVVIGNSVTKIGDSAFQGCSNMESLVLGNSVAEIGNGAFHSCSKLTSVNLPSSLEAIGRNPFTKCPNLEITVESDRFFMENDCLISKDSLLITGLNRERIIIPNSVKVVGNSAFTEQPNLTSLVIPNTVTKLRGSALSNCLNLKEISSLAVNPPTIEDDHVFWGLQTREIVLKVPTESIDLYKAAHHWKSFYNYVGIDPAGIEAVQGAESRVQSPAYSIGGVKASDGYKGIIVRGGKKMIVK